MGVRHVVVLLFMLTLDLVAAGGGKRFEASRRRRLILASLNGLFNSSGISEVLLRSSPGVNQNRPPDILSVADDLYVSGS